MTPMHTRPQSRLHHPNPSAAGPSLSGEGFGLNITPRYYKLNLPNHNDKGTFFDADRVLRLQQQCVR
jgi:hypothetical protein